MFLRGSMDKHHEGSAFCRPAPERFPVSAVSGVRVDAVVGVEIPGQDAVSLHLTDVRFARAKAGHVEPLDHVESRLRIADGREKPLIIYVVRVAENATLPRLKRPLYDEKRFWPGNVKRWAPRYVAI